jgi:hypothetical protein
LPRAGERKGSAAHSSRQAGELRALYDGGSAASVPDDAPRENPGRAAAPLAPSRPEASAAPRAPPASPPARAASRFPLRRGEITWKEAWRLANPASDANTVRAGFKSARERERESAMYRHNLGYLLGFQPYDFQKTEALKRDAERRRVLAERGARVRAAYGLPEFTSLSPPAAVLGRRLGAGGQGEAFLSATRPGYAVKTFRGATGEQLQEMAAILNAVADQGQPVARVRLVKIADGGYGLEMPEYSRADGWMDLATFVRFHRRAPEALAAESQAEEALRAVGRESERVLGVDAADWKAGLDGVVSDDHLENFMFNRKTGKIVGFDPLVKW